MWVGIIQSVKILNEGRGEGVKDPSGRGFGPQNQAICWSQLSMAREIRMENRGGEQVPTVIQKPTVVSGYSSGHYFMSSKYLYRKKDLESLVRVES